MPKPTQLLATIALASLVLISTPLFAQGKPIVPTAGQLELNEQGVEAVIAGNLPEAIHLFEASLALGPLNITHVNLGRAYQRFGECYKAERHFGLALDAPAIDNPTPKQVAATVNKYREELAQSCPGKVVVVCEPATIKLFVGDEGPLPCNGEELVRAPGDYLVRGELDGQLSETSVNVQPMKTSRAKLSISVSAAAALNPGSSPSEGGLETSVVRPPHVEPAANTGLYWLGGGGGVMLAGLALDIIPASAANGQYDALDFVPLALYAVGIAGVVYGVMLLMD
ncbi:MAG: hypothetical protein H0U74_21095 [Bradymonadaceae bacterium]|nr:hypothetical protein [Lujinxingiaceae bacterium]